MLPPPAVAPSAREAAEVDADAPRKGWRRRRMAVGGWVVARWREGEQLGTARRGTARPCHRAQGRMRRALESGMGGGVWVVVGGAGAEGGDEASGRMACVCVAVCGGGGGRARERHVLQRRRGPKTERGERFRGSLSLCGSVAAQVGLSLCQGGSVRPRPPSLLPCPWPMTTMVGGGVWSACAARVALGMHAGPHQTHAITLTHTCSGSLPAPSLTDATQAQSLTP